MCVLQPCANPTEEGVWWRDDTKWCLYGASHQAVIRNGITNQLQQVDLGTIVSAVHPEGARYVANLRTMEQVAVSSGQGRPVMVIDPVSTMTPQLEAPPQITLLPRRSFGRICPEIHFRDSQGRWQQYDPMIAQALIQCMASGSQSTLLVPDGQSGHFFFDLEEMEQYYVSDLVRGKPILSNEPPVKVIVGVPWDAAAMAHIAAKADKCLRRKILVMVIDRFRSDDHLDAILPMKACPWEIVSRITSTCSATLYEKFVDSVERAVQTFPGDIMGDMIKIAENKEAGDGPVQIAFKPGKCRAGSSSRFVDGEVATEAAFWTSMAAPVAAAHAVVYGCTVQILAYLVLLPIRSGTKFSETISDQSSRYVEVDRPEHQILLTKVTIR